MAVLLVHTGNAIRSEPSWNLTPVNDAAGRITLDVLLPHRPRMRGRDGPWVRRTGAALRCVGATAAMIQSDGCRVFNTALGRLPPPPESAAVSIYVSRKADVAKLDEFVGPKR